MKKIALKYGLWMLAGFIGFFSLMNLFGLATNPGWRIFNGFIHLAVIYLAIRQYRREVPESIDNYLSGVAMGMYTSMIGVVGFVLFMVFFFIFNPEFLEAIQRNTEIGQLGDYLTPITASIFILAEGIAVSLIGSYIVMRVVNMQLLETEGPKN